MFAICAKYKTNFATRSDKCKVAESTIIRKYEKCLLIKGRKNIQERLIGLLV